MIRSLLAKTILTSAILLAVLFLVGLASVAIGTTGIDLYSLLMGGAHDEKLLTSWMIFTSYRLPRTLLSAIAGAGLAVAGVVFQGVLRNPLADPYIIGIASGGSLGATISIALLRQDSVVGTSFFAFMGSLVAVLVVYGLAAVKKGTGYINTIILAGVIVGALFNALMLLIVSVSGSDEMQRILYWLMGDFSLADYSKIRVAGVITVVGAAAMYLSANRLNLLISGDDLAAYLGLNVAGTRAFFIAVAALITGTIVSVSGTIGFVGLVIPHAMRLVVGPDSRILLPTAFLGGAAFLAAADCVARLVAYPVELPVGVVTALAGAPFFLFLLARK